MKQLKTALNSSKHFMDKAEFYELFFDEVFRLDVIKETDDEIHFDSLANSFEIVWDKKDFIKVFFNDSSLEMKIPFDIVERLWYFYEYDLSSRDVYDLDHITKFNLNAFPVSGKIFEDVHEAKSLHTKHQLTFIGRRLYNRLKNSVYYSTTESFYSLMIIPKYTDDNNARMCYMEILEKSFKLYFGKKKMFFVEFPLT